MSNNEIAVGSMLGVLLIGSIITLVVAGKHALTNAGEKLAETIVDKALAANSSKPPAT